MAKQQQEAKEPQAEEPQQVPAAGGKRRKNLVLVGVIGGVMLIEGAAVFVLAKHFGAQPAAAEAKDHGGLNPEEGEKKPEPVELEIVRLRAQNEKAQRVVVYDLSVYAVTTKEHEEKLKGMVEQRRALIQDRFSSVIRSADPKVLMEADPATLRQKFKQELAQIVGDEKMIEQVLIPSIVSFREN